MKQAIILICTAVALAGCASSAGHTSGTPAKVTAASPQERAALLDQLKQLAGTWESVDDKGEPEGTTTFAVSSAGSIVREFMLAGTDHEMTNVYHMDGSTLVMTHYCAAGNQPRLRAVPGRPGVLDFKLDSVTNWTGDKQEYMGELTLTIMDKDHISQTWTSFADGKRLPVFVMQLRRKG